MSDSPAWTAAVDDGFGNVWMKCDRSYCDLQVVRPGKVQCNGSSRGGCGHDDEAAEMEQQFREGWDESD